jgi:hypothetical protein
MEHLVLPEGQHIKMSNIITITWKAGCIRFYHIDQGDMYALDWHAISPLVFNEELNRTTREYMDYLNRNGIPNED